MENPSVSNNASTHYGVEDSSCPVPERPTASGLVLWPFSEVTTSAFAPLLGDKRTSGTPTLSGGFYEYAPLGHRVGVERCVALIEQYVAEKVDLSV